jgi:hypothetical protein
MKATQPDTTPAAPPVGAPITGDALILALAAAYRETTAAIDKFDAEGPRQRDPIARYLDRQQKAHDYRRDSIEQAIVAIPATGVPGALVQIEVLHLMNEAGESSSAHFRARDEAIRAAALWSIFGVLSRATGRTAADGIEVMLPHRDDLRTDMPTLIREWRAFLAEDNVPVEAGDTRRAA